MFKILIEKKAVRTLRKLDEKTRKRITDALKLIEQEGFSAKLNIKKLSGYKNYYRLRIGNYRILFELSRDVIRVFSILPRKKAYRNL
ncbi:MAG: type II toxin-antitoxin system RelE family toxin [Candidatus Njordarchaeia archaeon]